MKIGLSIKRLREKLGMRQEDIAKQVGLSRSTIAQIEGDRRRVTVEELVLFGKAMNVSIEHLVNPELYPDEIVEPSEIENEEGCRERISIPQNNYEKFKEVLLYILTKVGAKPNIGETVLYKLLYFIAITMRSTRNSLSEQPTLRTPMDLLQHIFTSLWMK